MAPGYSTRSLRGITGPWANPDKTSMVISDSISDSFFVRSIRLKRTGGEQRVFEVRLTTYISLEPDCLSYENHSSFSLTLRLTCGLRSRICDSAPTAQRHRLSRVGCFNKSD